MENNEDNYYNPPTDDDWRDLYEQSKPLMDFTDEELEEMYNDYMKPKLRPIKPLPKLKKIK
jgi:hypothetical protein